MMESMQASARYQALIQRASAQGMERLQDKLARHSEPGRQIDSMKALYDLWVDASEEAYAEIALSDEFREVYGDMVNTQMRVRKMQLEQTEQLCQQLGVPTRSEVSSLGERLQALRREFRASVSPAPGAQDDEVQALKREISALKRQAAKRAATPAAAKNAAPKKTAVGKTARKAASGKSKTSAASTSRTSPRKRK
jgi:polyhydroxyalkanoate synthesis regulator phasin